MFILTFIAQAVSSIDPLSVVWVGVPAVPLIVGIVQVLKQAGLPSRFAGLVALALGGGGGFWLGAATADVAVPAAVVAGLMTGLSASGAWSVTSAVRASD
jgi:hypothetical protein